MSQSTDPIVQGRALEFARQQVEGVKAGKGSPFEGLLQALRENNPGIPEEKINGIAARILSTGDPKFFALQKTYGVMQTAWNLLAAKTHSQIAGILQDFNQSADQA